MMKENKEILLKANEAISNGDHEAFLSYCTEDSKWTFVGDQVLEGKETIRKWMQVEYQSITIFLLRYLAFRK